MAAATCNGFFLPPRVHVYWKFFIVRSRDFSPVFFANFLPLLRVAHKSIDGGYSKNVVAAIKKKKSLKILRQTCVFIARFFVNSLRAFVLDRGALFLAAAGRSRISQPPGFEVFNLNLYNFHNNSYCTLGFFFNFTKIECTTCVQCFF